MVVRAALMVRWCVRCCIDGGVCSDGLIVVCAVMDMDWHITTPDPGASPPVCRP